MSWKRAPLDSPRASCRRVQASDVDEMVRLYGQGLSLHRVGLLTGWSVSAVVSGLRERGVGIRPRMEPVSPSATEIARRAAAIRAARSRSRPAGGTYKEDPC